MYMSKADIIKDFKEAKNKANQIKILADLNQCRPAEIAHLLEDAGVTVPGNYARSPKAAKNAAEAKAAPKPEKLTPANTRAAILQRAAECVCGQREQDYGSPEDNFRKIADLWTAYYGSRNDGFNPVDVAMMMALLKIARITSGGTEDSFIDLAGYAACGAEIAAGLAK